MTYSPSISLVVRISEDQADANATLRIVHSLVKATSCLEAWVVCDGATGQSLAIVEKLSGLESRIQYIQLSRRFGSRASMLAGLAVARGERVLIAPRAAQVNLSLLRAMVGAAEQGIDVLEAPEQRGRASLRELLDRDSCRMTLLSRRVADALKDYPETSASLADMIASVGFSQRRLAVDLTTLLPVANLGSLDVPWSIMGAVAILFLMPLVGHTYWANLALSGWSTTLAIASGLGIATLLFNALMLIYIAGVERDVRRRPLYVIGKLTNRRLENSA